VKYGAPTRDLIPVAEKPPYPEVEILPLTLPQAFSKITPHISPLLSNGVEKIKPAGVSFVA